MKKFICSLLCGITLFGTVLLAGCGDAPKSDYEKYLSDGFVEVYQVTIENTISETFTSHYSIEYKSQKLNENTTYEEYKSLEFEEWQPKTSIDMNSHKEADLPEIGKTYKYFPPDSFYYTFYTIEVQSIKAKYILVKTVDDDLEIINTEGQHLLIHAPSYQIEYFN